MQIVKIFVYDYPGCASSAVVVFTYVICKRIKELRKVEKITLEQLAYRSGISKGGLSEIERNMKEPRAYTIFRICDGLGITMKEFFDFPEIDDFLDKV